MLNLTASYAVSILVLSAALKCQISVEKNEIQNPEQSTSLSAAALVQALMGDDIARRLDARDKIRNLESPDSALTSEILRLLTREEQLTDKSRCALIETLPYLRETDQATDAAIVQLSMSGQTVRSMAADVLRQLTNSVLSEQHAGLLVDAWMLEPNGDVRETIADTLALRFNESGIPWKDNREGKESGSILSLHPSARSWAVKSIERLAERVTNPSEFVSSRPIDLALYRDLLPLIRSPKSKLGRSGSKAKEIEPAEIVRLRLQQIVRYRAAWFLAALGEDAAQAVPGLLSTLVDESKISIELHRGSGTRYRTNKDIRMDDALAEVLGHICPNRSFEKLEEFRAYRKRRETQISDAEQAERNSRDEFWKKNEELQLTYTDRLKRALAIAETDNERITAIHQFGQPACVFLLRLSGNHWHNSGDTPPMSESERQTARQLFEEAVKGGDAGGEAKKALLKWIRSSRAKEWDISADFRDRRNVLTPAENYVEQSISSEEESLRKELIAEAREVAKSRGEMSEAEKAEALRKVLESGQKSSRDQ